MKKASIKDVFTTNGKIREDNKMVHDAYVMEFKRPSKSNVPWETASKRGDNTSVSAFVGVG